MPEELHGCVCVCVRACAQQATPADKLLCVSVYIQGHRQRTGTSPWSPPQRWMVKVVFFFLPLIYNELLCTFILGSALNKHKWSVEIITVLNINRFTCGVRQDFFFFFNYY